MKDVREMFNISYFDNKELSLKEHCDIYSNIKKELISILNKYDIKYVLAETEVIKDLSKENKKYKEVIDKAMKCINYNTKYRNGADIYQFVDIESEILRPLKDILEQNEENGNAYLKEFNDWLKELEQLKEIEKEHRTINGELRVENKELKKQLEEADLELQLLDMITDENIKYKNQQKEFIEFLEHQVKLQEEINDIHLVTGFEEILSKYKEIIGSDSNE